MRRWLLVSVLAALLGRSAFAADLSLLSRTNLVAWCIVPFDAKKRGPEGRGEMLERLGLQRVAYDWREEHIAFKVDGAPVFESSVSPQPPLGIVIWIDNQYAAFTPEGKIGFGVLENPEPAWLEVKDIDVT